MDQVRNPFNPGAGSRPPLLVGREAQIGAMTVAVRRLAIGRFERSVMLKGLRGVGKTVLLNEFGRIAQQEGWIHAHLEATEDIRIASATAALTRRVLLELSVRARAKDRAARALGVLRSFIKVHVPLGSGTGSLVIDFEPQHGQADSGQLDGDLSALFAEVGETARDAGIGVLLTIDEIQYLGRAELSALIIGLHRVSQLSLPLLVAGAGLPSLPGLAGEARSYAERLFRYVDIGSLGHGDATAALSLPAEQEGAGWSTDAVEEVIQVTLGYPYFLQEFGKQAWNLATGPLITLDDVQAATMLAVDDLDQGFFRARIDKTTDAERDYLRAMAALGGPGPYRSGDVSKHLGKKTTQTGPIRDSLIKRGLCYAPRHGDLAFTVPMFDEFIRRALT
ncbi:MAG: ATP-binding protein [Actinobacteria bacterium]|nr:ATP-binding protein [Actinomycetota bacterium]